MGHAVFVETGLSPVLPRLRPDFVPDDVRSYTAHRAPPGMAIDGRLGASTKTDRWREVPLDRVRVSLGPQRDGRFGLGASVRF